jgi:quercetin dioxygenase-like cupin family protein
MDVDNLKIGSAVNAPTVSASMATALLAYSGIAVKMLVDQRLGAVLHSLFMVEYQPGGSALPHDHPLEESYYILEGEVVATANDDEFTLRAGDVFWTGVGCIHAFYNRGSARVRWLETQAPQLPSNYSYRFNRDWDYLEELIGGNA